MSTNSTLTLSHGKLDVSLLVPSTDYVTCAQLREAFSKSLPTPTADLADDAEPSSPAELLASFLLFTALQVRETPGPFNNVLTILLKEFDDFYLKGRDVHNFATILQTNDVYPTTLSKVKSLIKSYYTAKVIAKQSFNESIPSLFKNKNVEMYSIFGGQGNTEDYFDELRELYNIYNPLIGDFIKLLSDKLISLSRQDANILKVYAKGLNIIQWLENPDSTPGNDYLLSIAISCPIIAVIQLSHYAVTAKVLGLNPGQLKKHLKGATGHSQGLITAVAIAASDSWASFNEQALKCVSFLFYVGVRCLQTYPNTALPPSVVEDSIENGEGNPYPMLSIRDLTQKQVQNFIDKTNKHLPNEQHVTISLINGARNFVISGPPMSLYGLNLSLRKEKSAVGLDQARIPHSKRKLKFTNRFLPITSPFHSNLLVDAIKLISNDLKREGITYPQSDLSIPVFDTFDGKDLRKYDGNLGDRIIELITHIPVNWQIATNFKATHILEFGPGGISGLGVLTHRNKDGTGVRLILAGVFDGELNEEYGYKQEIFDLDDLNIKWNQNWLEEFKPKLVKTSTDDIYVDTRFSRLLGKQPIMVPGMTPTTVHSDFVAATLNAGYQIEVAGGGYFDPIGMTKCLKEIEKSTIPGTGISINLIYVNPRMLQWGIPMIKDLRTAGFPIEGLTIGAGVPSLEVASEYINELGIKHLGLKPGSIDAISSVINIAKNHPNFPIVLQWTGGRAGGHHSYEDFHAPLLQMYSKIRRQSNISLVIGSGFGSSEDTYPYLTGEWSIKYSYPPMPVDGVLFGSRVMTAKEAHTSQGAKLAIKDAPGVDDDQWEQCYNKPTGGVITVDSEMGESIHKLATRGVLFWAEMDKTIFSIPKKKRVEALLKKKDYIIKKLNDDFQKTWFGRDKNGDSCDLEDMSYIDIVSRSIELLYVKKEKRWIDLTLRNFVGTFIRRLEERFTSKSGKLSILQSFSELENPFKVLETLNETYPDAKDQLINAQDKDHFLTLCLNPFQKPVPFVPVLDDNFDFYFKKDSLWQSEDLAAVVGEDVGRTCILHGPVAAKFTNEINVPIKELLDGISKGHVSKILEEEYDNDIKKIPVVEYFGHKPPISIRQVSQSDITSVTIYSDLKHDTVTYTIDSDNSSTLPSDDAWFTLLAGDKYSWRHAFFATDLIVQNTLLEPTPIRRILKPTHGLKVTFKNVNDLNKLIITAEEPLHKKLTKVLEIKKVNKEQIQLLLIESRTADHKPVALELLYNYRPRIGYAPIVEVMESRNDRIKEFYWKLWFGNDDKFDLNINVNKPIIGEKIKITKQQIAEFVHAVGNRGEAYIPRAGKETFAPMDFAIVAGWKAIIKALFPKTIDGDLLKLVHLSNGFSMVPGAEPLKDGDIVSSSAEVRAVINQPNGKVVEVCGTISRDNKPVLEVTSSFYYRGNYTDFENSFQKSKETPMQITLSSAKDVAVLKSKQWFQIDDEDFNLLGQTLTFRLESFVRFKDYNVFSEVSTTGQILVELPSKEIIQIGTVDYEASTSHGNPVIDYLKRNGNVIEQPILFENAIPFKTSSEDGLTLKAPASNEPYAIVSGDYNPIHVSRVFSAYADLKGTITHGMYSSASVRSLVEVFAANNVVSRVRAFNCNFIGMVLPYDNIEVKLEHVGMINGRKIVKVSATNKDTEAIVLTGEAEIEQPSSTYVFTGQGSQEQGMGMDLYESSEVAKAVWDRADRHFLASYGFSIIDIVKNNPKELTVHFGGPKGKAIRENYISMMFESIDKDGKLKSEKIFKEITESTTFFTFKSNTGLLSATQFTQPALTLMEKASFEDMKSKGLVPSDALFAGHSLGEYSALASLGDVMPIESLVDVVFYRGMTMQVAVPRDSQGRSNYGMCAVNPSRISSTFRDDALRFVVSHIAQQTGWLLEIVNYNIQDQQYVTAGDLRALDTLTNVLNLFKVQKIDIVKLQEIMSIEKVKEHLNEIVSEVSKQSEEKEQPIDLQRGFAVIPLKGISVPFHSSYLRSGVKPFQNFLVKKVPKTAVKPANLIGKYIPNLTAEPFEISKEYFQKVYDLTGSEKIKSILDNWEKYESS